MVNLPLLPGLQVVFATQKTRPACFTFKQDQSEFSSWASQLACCPVNKPQLPLWGQTTLVRDQSSLLRIKVKGPGQENSISKCVYLYITLKRFLLYMCVFDSGEVKCVLGSRIKSRQLEAAHKSNQPRACEVLHPSFHPLLCQHFLSDLLRLFAASRIKQKAE